MLVGEFQENPVSRMLDDVRTQILESLEKQNISIDAEEHLRDTNLIKRMVMKRSIYGVDLNPMAVELAKLSLWLDSFTVGAPLSFLDHHLRAGNSLIGTTVNEVKFTLEIDEDSQIDIFGGPFAGLLTATELMRNVALKTDATIGEIEESIEQFSEYEKAVLPYKKLLDLWLSQHFDNDKAIMLLRQYPEKVIAKYKGQKSDLKKQYKPILEQAEKRAQEKEFFHWELEFPEVFVDLRKTKWLENPGFDVVIGNPPYIRIQELNELSPDIPEYLKTKYKSAYGVYDIYLLFVEKGMNLLQSKGHFGYILPNKFFQLDFGSGLRELLIQKKSIKEIIDLSGNQIFKGQTTYTCLLILQGSENHNFKYVKFPISNSPEKDVPKWLFDELPKPKAELNINNFTPDPWLLVSGDEKSLIDKLDSCSTPLNELINRVIVGLQTSADYIYSLNKIAENEDEFIAFSKSLNKEVKFEKDLLKPLISGKDVDRYKHLATNELLIFPYKISDDGAELISKETLENNYPLTWNYLLENESDLRGRESGKMDHKGWYGYVYPKNLDKHEIMKLCTARLVDHLSFTADY